MRDPGRRRRPAATRPRRSRSARRPRSARASCAEPSEALGGGSSIQSMTSGSRSSHSCQTCSPGRKSEVTSAPLSSSMATKRRLPLTRPGASSVPVETWMRGRPWASAFSSSLKRSASSGIDVPKIRSKRSTRSGRDDSSSRSRAPDRVAAAANRPGWVSASFIAPYPPMTSPATYVSARVLRDAEEVADDLRQLLGDVVPVAAAAGLVGVEAAVDGGHHDREARRGGVALDRGVAQPGGVVVGEAVQQVEHREVGARDGRCPALDPDLLLGRLRKHDGHRAADLEDVGEEVAGDERHAVSLQRLQVNGRDDRLALRHLLHRPRQLGAVRRRAGRARRRAARGRRPRRRGPARRGAAGRCRRSSGGVPMPITSASATPCSSSRRSANLRPPMEILSGLFFATETIAPVVALAGDQLVDEAAGRVPAAGDQLGADAVAVDRRGGQRRDRVLVEVAGHHDPGLRGAEVVELLADPVGEHAEVAGVEADGAQLRCPRSRRRPDGLEHVVGVDEQRGAACRARSPARGTRRPRCRGAA